MESPLLPPPTGSSNTSEATRLPQLMSPDRKDPSRSAWIAQQARLVLSSYRRDDFADPDSFLLQLGMVLERYADEIIREITSPLTGIQRKQFKHSGPPTIADIVEACDNEVARLGRIRRFSSMQTARFAAHVPRHRGNVFVPPGALGYEAMCELAKTGDPMNFCLDNDRAGIWVALDIYEAHKNKQAIRQFRGYTEEELLRLYGREPSKEKPNGEATREKEEAEWHDYMDGR